MKKICIVGLGKSGQMAAELALSVGNFEVYLYDDNPKADNMLSEDLLTHQRVKLFADLQPPLQEIDLFVVSPGVPPKHHLVREAYGRGIPVWGDVEFAFRFVTFEAPRKFVTVTGTNGKTTTTAMIAHMLQKAGNSVFVGGNYGVPLSSYVLEGEPVDFVVLELSSFQIAYMDSFVARGGVFLNLAQDHMDWHKDFNDYVETKLGLSSRLLEFVVANGDDELLKKNFDDKDCFFFSFNKGQAFMSDGKMVVNGKIAGSIAGLSERDVFNLPNILAALTVVDLLGIDPKEALGSLKDFQYPRFRMEPVGDFNGIKVYNDSKATNPHAVLKALQWFDSGKSVVLILGGQNKDMDFTLLRDEIRNKVKCLVIYGDSAEMLAEVFEDVVPLELKYNFDDAVRCAIEMADKGGIILLSPGCASFDQFSSYVERGEAFNELIKKYLKDV
ncbi:UDP-N-acetylmuramoylalanine--D-glutamate ligase [Thermosulfidibacter takaii ABI70S6]|uniref:UDP-N-acetylmuramoylalanine--D-glutamate ligase n=1 Tax=Thermosulfidibacter takaii (strain DSM 17441 / JCM 13301 / NBRC 103674 / ABI70S6) TaxID=1298851 RepID=A0A0S3QU49_THET7|nr:UDP-N-acetylmuramoyl-L-alanine--D-glutamate ligase [Thermosulfidibacter takaii]BAT71846.1 UDP-N-acetylmuramoylalanine--D-glutamate ligase [Thermosulfidibacter takaii ABI70S6]